MALAAAVSAAAILAACGGSDSKNNNSGNKDLPQDIAQNYRAMAGAVYSDSLSTAEDFQDAVDVFLADPTEQNLEAARTEYKEMRVPYQQSEIMRWDEGIAGEGVGDEGPASVDDWEGQVNAWPLDEAQIEDIISGGASSEDITTSLLVDKNGALPDGTEDEANVTTGVHAVEFMLWDRDEEAKGPGQRAASEFASLSSCAGTFTTEACRNSKYLEVATQLLVDDLSDMAAEWTAEAANTEGTLAYNFLESDSQGDYILQAIASMAVGELGGARLSAGLWRDASVLETLTPDEGETFKAGDHEEEHDCFSDLSHVAVYYNFQGIKNALNGSYTALDGTVVSGASFGDYINSVYSAGYEDLVDKLDAVEVELKKVYDAGERETNAVSFDDIIAASQAHYEDGVAKTEELIALENAITLLGETEEITKNISDSLALADFDPDTIGETD